MKKIFSILLAVIAAWLLFEWFRFPDVAKLQSSNPDTTAFMERRREQLRDEGKPSDLEYRFVKYERISPYLRRAVLVSEDSGFYEHQGVDEKALREALERDWKNRKLSHGGSTITQQLAKNLYLSPSKNPLRKLREYFIARALERELSKKRILELYLNVVEMGERVYGAEAAARHYFDRSASTLTPAQAALLAGCLPNPRKMNPGSPNGRLRARQRIILSRMRRWGYLVEREALRESGKKRVEAPPPSSATEPPEPVTDTTIPSVDGAAAEEPATTEEVPAAQSPSGAEPPPAEVPPSPPPTESVVPQPSDPVP